MTKKILREHSDPLTERETEVLRLLAAGNSNKEVAVQLVISVGTVKWYVQQIYRKLGVNRRTQAIARARELKLLEAVSEAVSSARHKSNIPLQTTSFIGREEDIDEVRRLLLNEVDCRLLMLLGPGGIGKSRLALAVATDMFDEMPDGVYFVSLAPISEVEDIVPAIAESLNFTFYGKTNPVEQLLDYLKSKKLLLVLDNFEHLLDGVELLSDILKHAPHVLLLTTSRERLNLYEEWVYELSGLSYPAEHKLETESESEIDMETYQAIQLFSLRARQANTSFSSTDEIVDIIRICQLVEGMPLGLELAAGWVRTLTCNEIALEIERSLDILRSSQRNLPERHQSLRIVLEQSWQHLSVGEQSVLSQLSVFRGGCTREAAQVVTGATLPVMSSLINKALLRRTDTGRYEIHELIRQFAEEQLQQDTKQTKQVQDRHREYFVSLLEARAADVKSNKQNETLTEIKADIDNIRLAWRESIVELNEEAIERAAECLFLFYLYDSSYDSGYTEFGRVVSAFVGAADLSIDAIWVAASDLTDHQKHILAFVLAAHGYFLAHRRDLRAGQKFLEQTLALLQETKSISPQHHANLRAFTLQFLGWTVYFQGQIMEAERYARESLSIYSSIDDLWGMGWSLCLLGISTRNSSPVSAASTLKKGITVCEESGDHGVLAYNTYNLGHILVELGQYRQAQEYIDRGVVMAADTHNKIALGYSHLYRGRLEIALGDYVRATNSIEISWEHFNEVGIVHISRAKVYLGTAYRLQGNYQRSKQLYEQAYAGLQIADSRLVYVNCFNGLGCLEVNIGNLQQAEEYHREALRTAQELHMEPAQAASLYYLGAVMVGLGDKHTTEARRILSQSLALASRHQLAPIALAAFVELAILELQTDNTKIGITLLTIASQHEASTHETRERAIQTLARLKSNSTKSIRMEVNDPDLWRFVETIISKIH